MEPTVIFLDDLDNVTGGADKKKAAPAKKPEPTWWETVKKNAVVYAGACGAGVAQANIFNPPKNRASLALNTGVGCVGGLAYKGIKDLTGYED